jgi:hypothetical protein
MPVFTQNVELKGDFINMMTDLQNLGMTQKPAKEEKHHIEFYDKKADAVWKNIAHGNNVVVLNNLENSQSLEYLKSSFVNLINKPGNKYGSLDPKKINIIQLNENATYTEEQEYLEKKRVYAFAQSKLEALEQYLVAYDKIKSIYAFDKKLKDLLSEIKSVITINDIDIIRKKYEEIINNMFISGEE